MKAPLYNTLYSLFLLACVAISVNCLGQSSNFVNYSVEDGLVQSQVQTINQDAAGNLWIGTINGVSYYNGLEFKSIKRKDGLAEDWITSSCMDKSGNLWFGHWGGGVSFCNIESGEVIVKTSKKRNYRCL